MAVQGLADVRGAHHRLDAWLHRPSFLVPNESVLRSSGAIPARTCRADSDAGAARLLPGWKNRARPEPTTRMASEQSFATRSRDGSRAEIIGRYHRLFPDRLSRPDRICLDGERRAAVA